MADIRDEPYQGWGQPPPEAAPLRAREVSPLEQEDPIEASIQELMRTYPGMPYGEAYNKVVFLNKDMAEAHGKAVEEATIKAVEKAREAQDRVTRERLAMLLTPAPR